jgi:PadR family transcriptional regulator, regulatory protein AphA
VSRKRESPLGTEIALLGLLRARPMHGYEIHQQLSAPTGLGLIWRVKQAQLYALLDRFETVGYVAATLQPQEKAPPRKVLSLTTEGSDAYEEWVCSPVPSARAMRIDFLAKLYLAQQERPDVRCALIDAQRQTCQVWLARLKQQATDAATPFDMTVWQFRIGQVEALLGWLDDYEGTISTGGEK